MDTSYMLNQMCHKVLSVADVKAICKSRGFSGKEAASRAIFENFFLSDIGVEAALGSLAHEEVVFLHLLKRTDKAVDLAFFERLYGSAKSRDLKAEHPFFLIPKNPKFEHRWDEERGRYGNFHESKDHWGHEIPIPEDAADAFERVEGRYVERFLEGIPLVMGYVEVAYRRAEYKGLFPEMSQLPAFRVNDRFLHAMAGEIPAPKVTVQPNFELHVESEFYPAQVLSRLTPLADVVTEDTTITLKLRQKEGPHPIKQG